MLRCSRNVFSPVRLKVASVFLRSSLVRESSPSRARWCQPLHGYSLLVAVEVCLETIFTSTLRHIENDTPTHAPSQPARACCFFFLRISISRVFFVLHVLLLKRSVSILCLFLSPSTMQYKVNLLSLWHLPFLERWPTFLPTLSRRISLPWSHITSGTRFDVHCMYVQGVRKGSDTVHWPLTATKKSNFFKNLRVVLHHRKFFLVFI